MPDYPIPKLIPVRAVNHVDLNKAVAKTLLYHQQQIRKAVSQSGKLSDPANDETIALE